MIKFRCSNCKKKFGVPDDYAGRRIRCNTCDQHSFVPQESNIDTPTATSVAPVTSQPASCDDQIITIKDLANTQGRTEDKPMVFQMQSFHDYTLPASKPEDPDPDEPTTTNLVSDLIKRSCPNPKTDRIEQTLGFLSYISCIGPVFFILIVIAAGFIASHNNSPKTMRAPFAEPATGPIEGPTSLLAAFPAIRYAFYAFTCGICPLALIGALFIVLKYCYDMPKLLYFSIVLHGLIFFNIFSG